MADLLICCTCGTQFSTSDRSALTNCRICEDPRQFVPLAGHTFTTMSEMISKHQNKWEQNKIDSCVWSIWTEPRFAIGQRAMLLQTAEGNVLWDCITHLDARTVEWINSIGGIRAIVMSHPHFYSTHLEWAKAFQCPVYLSREDEKWLNRPDTPGVERRFVEGATLTIVPGVTAVKTGGHFDGSMVLHWEKHLFISDTLHTVPSAYYNKGRQPGTISYVAMWSYPNMIPLPPAAIQKIWEALKPYEFTATFGAFMGMDLYGANLKGRLLESMKIQIRGEGWEQHKLLEEVWDRVD
ncbi:related to metallo-beta-lactamase family protein [Phialocephala subalpina]|uniref:Related to metallo-beta-lactamase family protein n=1 Tax=Phialocephala subalpina TaxID=576137 RepID=A0A1L7XLT7_9HELO|nr:related to metallo-beta-lactamase family protein [Phialocephala subalpina]